MGLRSFICKTDITNIVIYAIMPTYFSNQWIFIIGILRETQHQNQYKAIIIILNIQTLQFTPNQRQNMLNSIFFGKNSVASMRLKLFSKLDYFLKIEFVKLEFQPKIKFLKLDLHLTLIL